MLGKLKEIKEIFNFKKDTYEFDGFAIETDKHIFRILIQNETKCCEQDGYFSSEDDYSSFIGKELVEVSVTDTALNTKTIVSHLQELEEMRREEDGANICFVNFYFVDGDKLQFAVYNEHNGYYGHWITFMKDDETFLSDYI